MPRHKNNKTDLHPECEVGDEADDVCSEAIDLHASQNHRFDITIMIGTSPLHVGEVMDDMRSR